MREQTHATVSGACLPANPLLHVGKWFDLCEWASDVLFVYQKCDIPPVVVPCFVIVFYDGWLNLSISFSFWAHSRNTLPGSLAGFASPDWLNQGGWVHMLGSSQWGLRRKWCVVHLGKRNMIAFVTGVPLSLWWLTALRGQVIWARNKPCGLGACLLSKSAVLSTQYSHIRLVIITCIVLYDTA